MQRIGVQILISALSNVSTIVEISLDAIQTLPYSLKYGKT
jgi:hypothetical protein